MTEERASYHVGQEPAQESAHEHLYRVVVGNKLVVRFCERCGRTWLTTELRDILHNNRFVYCWSEVLEEAEAHEKLIPTEEQPRSRLKRYCDSRNKVAAKKAITWPINRSIQVRL